MLTKVSVRCNISKLTDGGNAPEGGGRTLKTEQCRMDHPKMNSSQMCGLCLTHRPNNFFYRTDFGAMNGSVKSIHFMESLILAQDERWRRA